MQWQVYGHLLLQHLGRAVHNLGLSHVMVQKHHSQTFAL